METMPSGMAESPKSSNEWLGLGVAIAGFVVILAATELGWLRFATSEGQAQPQIGRMLAITWLMAVCWMTEALPIAATSLFPIALFPLLGIMPSGLVARQYMNEIIVLFMGGFFLAIAIQRWDLHKRISLVIVTRSGGRPAQLVLGFMLASAFLSMWISNTATTLMLLPIALSVAQFYEKEDPKQGRQLGLLLLLSVAYSASLGGIATLVGTPTNLSFVRIFKIYFPKAPEITFVQWLQIGLPVTFVLLPLFWFVMTQILFREAVKGSDPETQKEAQKMLKERLTLLGPMTQTERWVLVIFAMTAFLWITRADIKLGAKQQIPGWTSVLGLTYQKKLITYKKNTPKLSLPNTTLRGPTTYTRVEKTRKKALLGDGAVAIMMALLLFLIPAGKERQEEGKPTIRLMDWESAKDIPWGMLLLFGGGFALAAGIKKSGMSQWVGEWFKWPGLGQLSIFVIILIICLTITFVTEFTSNTATAEITLAIMAPIALVFGGKGAHPYLLMIPVTLAASCAFMMPVATPPNAIAYSSGYIPMKTMVRTGILLNILSTIVIALLLTLIFSMMKLNLLVAPSWIR